MPKINLDNVSTHPEPVEVDTYTCRFTGHKFVTAAKTGNNYVNFEFTGDQGESKGRKFFGIGMLTPEGIWMFKRICVAIGIDEFPADFDTDSAADVKALLEPNYGSYVDLAIGQEQAQDKNGNPQDFKRNVILRYGVEEMATAKAPF
jgi:hypothetical protein